MSASCDVASAYREPIGMYIFKKYSCGGVWAPVRRSHNQKKNIHTLRFYQRRSDEYAAGVAPRQIIQVPDADVVDAHTVVFNAIASLVPPTPAVDAPALSTNPRLVPAAPGMDVPFPPTASTADLPPTVPTTPTVASITAATGRAAAKRIAATRKHQSKWNDLAGAVRPL